MRLRNKLFLFVGVLLLAVSLAVYLIPAHLGRKRVAEVREQAHQWLNQLKQQEYQQVLSWLQGAAMGLEAGIDAYLYLVQQTPALADAFSSGESMRGWDALADLMVYSSHLDFAQNDRPDGSSLVVALGAARLYPVLQLPIASGLLWVISDENEVGPYIGVLSHQKDGDTFPQRCFLFTPEEILSMPEELSEIVQKGGIDQSDPAMEAVIHSLVEAQQILERAVKASQANDVEALKQAIKEAFAHHQAAFTDLPEAKELGDPESGYQIKSPYMGLISEWGEPVPQESNAEANDLFAWRVIESAQRLDDLRMIRSLGNLLASGLGGGKIDRVEMLAGVARFQEKDRAGVAILSRDLISTVSLFDAAEHFRSHPPSGELPIASRTALVPDSRLQELAVVNTLKLESAEGESAFLTAGTSISFLTSELSLHTNAMVAAVYNGSVVSGFGPDGTTLDPTAVAELQNAVGKGAEAGSTITYKGNEYVLWEYEPYETFPVTFVVLESDEVFEHLVDWISTEARQTIESASHVLFLVSFGVFVASLVVLEWIARRITSPIASLADATRLVVQGKYDAVVLPDVAKSSRNEVSVLTRSFREMVQGLIDKERIRSVLNKSVSKEIADQILQQDIKYEGEVRKITVLFADIRNFTGITEDMPPTEVIALLNEYMSWASDIIEGHRGVIDKYIGDEVMALYGAPVEFEHAPLQAIVTAILLRQRLGEWNQERRRAGHPPIQIGMGIHYGRMVAGNMGGELRQNYTVLGANVNLASRLCSGAEGGEILISDRLRSIPEVEANIEVEARGEFEFKGFSQPIRTYAVVGFRDRNALEALGIRTTY